MNKRKGGDALSHAQSILLGLLSTFGIAGVTTTVLVKLVYLMDWRHYRLFGETLTGFAYKFDHHGPNAEGHAIVGSLERLVEDGYVVVSSKAAPSGRANIWHIKQGFDASSIPLSGDDWVAIHTVKHNYGSMSREEIVQLTKHTAPMLDLEKGETITFEQDMVLTDEQVAADPFLQGTVTAIEDHSNWITIEKLRERVAQPDKD